MRRAKKESGGSLDSLLDTMTNVVGILVILLTITQLGVSDAVKRIGSGGGVQPEVIDEAREELEKLLKLRADLLARLEALIGEEDEDPEKRLLRLNKEIQDLEANIAVLMETQEAKKREAELELMALKNEAQEKIRAQEEEANKLRTQILENEDELASLRAKLEKTPVQGPLPAKVINLPNPRPAPEGAQPLVFLCREGRIMLADVEAIREIAWKRTSSIIQKRRLGRDPKAGIDGKILSQDFNKNPISDRNRHFDVTMTIAGRVPKLVLERRENAGETTEEVRRPTSRYQQRVRRTDPDEYYLQFLVWPDSFEVYLESRKISAGRGLLAGWQAQTTKGEYTIDLGGDLRVGPPPPPPPPKPKPKPGEEPPPPPKPKPRPRPVPTDVID